MEDNGYTNLKEICSVQIELDANLHKSFTEMAITVY